MAGVFDGTGFPTDRLQRFGYLSISSKIDSLLFLAGALCEPLTPLQFLLVSATAAVHVGILVVSRDLGGAVIFYITYITLLFLATGKRRLLTGGLLLGNPQGKADGYRRIHRIAAGVIIRSSVRGASSGSARSCIIRDSAKRSA